MGQAAVRNQLAVLDTARNALEATDAVRQIANQLIVDQQEAAAKQAVLEREVAELRQVVNGLLKARDAARADHNDLVAEVQLAGRAASVASFRWQLLSASLRARLRFVLFGELPR